MPYIHLKTENSYLLIRTAINCNNDNPIKHEECAIYTREQGWFIKLRLFIIRLLLPEAVYIRNMSEFKEKFDYVD